jgi:hypothetical protein
VIVEICRPDDSEDPSPLSPAFKSPKTFADNNCTKFGAAGAWKCVVSLIKIYSYDDAAIAEQVN